MAWDETDDPIRLVQTIVAGSLPGGDPGPDAGPVRACARALDPAELVEAGPTMSALRRIKDPEMIALARPQPPPMAR